MEFTIFFSCWQLHTTSMFLNNLSFQEQKKALYKTNVLYIHIAVYIHIPFVNAILLVADDSRICNRSSRRAVDRYEYTGG